MLCWIEPCTNNLTLFWSILSKFNRGQNFRIKKPIGIIIDFLMAYVIFYSQPNFFVHLSSGCFLSWQCIKTLFAFYLNNKKARIEIIKHAKSIFYNFSFTITSIKTSTYSLIVFFKKLCTLIFVISSILLVICKIRLINLVDNCKRWVVRWNPGLLLIWISKNSY